MKKIITLIAAVAAMASASAQESTITLDINNPSNPASLEFGSDGIWTGTYNETDYTYLEFPPFAFSHLLGGEGSSWGGMYWDGFTISRNSGKSGWQGNMAGGGLDGADDPYLIGFWAEFSESADSHSTELIFDDGNNYRPQAVYVTNIATSYSAVTNGDSYARKFDREGDSFMLYAHGVAPSGEVRTASIELAGYHNGTFSALTDWTRWDLTSLGRVESIYFTMSSTDSGAYGMNTAAYFALAGMTVSNPKPTAIESIEATAPVVGVTYYNLQGVASAEPHNGLNIVVKTHSDGSRTTAKLLK
ncbi:MAG: DUF4465 domain-containing protein [Muribaculaceae bacterium]|nr:DUF4465 domain-containing protein [Muribaculaceae bacterium]